MVARAFVALALLPTVAAVSCTAEAVASLRSPAVQSSFDPAKLVGMWYEHGFKDVAQVGTSCQTLNFTMTSGQLAADLRVEYPGGPFTLTEYYDRTEGVPAVYSKHVNMPLGSLVHLPTAVMDVQTSPDSQRYESMSMYSCKGFVTELVFATRSRSITEAEFQVMMETARRQGADFDSSSITQVDWSKCSPTPGVAPSLTI